MFFFVNELCIFSVSVCDLCDVCVCMNCLFSLCAFKIAICSTHIFLECAKRLSFLSADKTGHIFGFKQYN